MKFQEAKTFNSGDNEFLIPPTLEAEKSEVLKNPGILGTFKNFLVEKIGFKKAGTGLFGLLGKQGANLSSLYGVSAAGALKLSIIISHLLVIIKFLSRLAYLIIY